MKIFTIAALALGLTLSTGLFAQNTVSTSTTTTTTKHKKHHKKGSSSTESSTSSTSISPTK